TNLFFHPVGAGTTTLTVIQPSGFSTPANRPPLTATVTATGINVSTLTKLGKDLERNVSWSLQAPTTAVAGIDVTLTSSDPTKLRSEERRVGEGGRSGSVHVG